MGLDEKKKEYWVSKVKTKWHPPEGLFAEGSAEEIADVLARESDSLRQAMARLNFYINRAGKNLSPERRKELEKAKEILRKKFAGEKEEPVVYKLAADLQDDELERVLWIDEDEEGNEIAFLEPEKSEEAEGAAEGDVEDAAEGDEEAEDAEDEDHPLIRLVKLLGELDEARYQWVVRHGKRTKKKVRTPQERRRAKREFLLSPARRAALKKAQRAARRASARRARARSLAARRRMGL